MNALDTEITRKLPTMFWARTVQYKMGGMSYGKIQKKLQAHDKEGDKLFWETYSRRFYKYSKGAGIRDKQFIDLVEINAPGTKKILFHPLWDILKNPEASLEEIFSYMNRLDFDLRKKLFTTHKTSKVLVRKPLDRFSQINYVALGNDLDALACLLMFIRESEIKEQIQAYIWCKWEAVLLVYRLAMIPFYRHAINLLHYLVFNLFVEKNHPLPLEFGNKYWEDNPFNRDIPKNYPILLIQDTYSGILWNAEHKKIISSNEQEHLTFLFWVDHFIDRNELKKALIRLPSGFDTTQPSPSFPPPLDRLMEILRGDSRKYLLGKGVLLF